MDGMALKRPRLTQLVVYSLQFLGSVTPSFECLPVLRPCACPAGDSRVRPVCLQAPSQVHHDGLMPISNLVLIGGSTL